MDPLARKCLHSHPHAVRRRAALPCLKRIQPKQARAGILFVMWLAFPLMCMRCFGPGEGYVIATGRESATREGLSILGPERKAASNPSLSPCPYFAKLQILGLSPIK